VKASHRKHIAYRSILDVISGYRHRARARQPDDALQPREWRRIERRRAAPRQGKVAGDPQRDDQRDHADEQRLPDPKADALEGCVAID